MAVTIQDDMYRAAMMLPQTQRAPFLMALIEYGMTGTEPKGRPQWLPTFEVCKDRINMSNEASERGRRMAEGRWGKKNDKHDAQADTQASCTSTDKHDAQADAEVRRGKNEVRGGEASDARTRARAREVEGWCMDERHESFRVLDSDGKGHQRPSESLAATYASAHGSPSGFSRVRQAMERPRCAGCARDEDSVITCHNTVRDALAKWDRPLDGDPSRIIRKMLAEDVDGNG